LFVLLEIAGLSRLTFLEIKIFSSGTLTTLPLLPSLQTFFATSTTLWAYLLQILSF